MTFSDPYKTLNPSKLEFILVNNQIRILREMIYTQYFYNKS